MNPGAGLMASTMPPAGVADAAIPAACRVRRVSRETPDTWTFEIAPPDGFDRTEFAAGQFNMLYAFGIGEAPVSISGDPTVDSTLVHTIRAVGPVTRALCALRPGESVGVRGPFGRHFASFTERGDQLPELVSEQLRACLSLAFGHRASVGLART